MTTRHTPDNAPASAAPGRAFDAVLCDLDNVVRFYDTAPLTALERTAGLPEGATTDIAYAPEVDLPLLLGRITPDAWVESIVCRRTTAAHRPTARVRPPGPRSGPPQPRRCGSRPVRSWTNACSADCTAPA